MRRWWWMLCLSVLAEEGFASASSLEGGSALSWRIQFATVRGWKYIACEYQPISVKLEALLWEIWSFYFLNISFLRNSKLIPSASNFIKVQKRNSTLNGFRPGASDHLRASRFRSKWWTTRNLKIKNVQHRLRVLCVWEKPRKNDGNAHVTAWWDAWEVMTKIMRFFFFFHKNVLIIFCRLLIYRALCNLN